MWRFACIWSPSSTNPTRDSLLDHNHWLTILIRLSGSNHFGGTSSEALQRGRTCQGKVCCAPPRLSYLKICLFSPILRCRDRGRWGNIIKWCGARREVWILLLISTCRRCWQGLSLKVASSSSIYSGLFNDCRLFKVEIFDGNPLFIVVLVVTLCMCHGYTQMFAVTNKCAIL